MATYGYQLLSKNGRFYKSSKTLQINPQRKMSNVSNYFFAGIVEIMFSCLSPDMLQTWKNCTLAISFRVFYFIMQI